MPRIQDLKVKYLEIEPTNNIINGVNITGDAVIQTNLSVDGDALIKTKFIC